MLTVENEWIPVALHSCQHWVFRVLNFGHSGKYIVVCYCRLNLQLPNGSWRCTSFNMLGCRLCICSGEASGKSFSHFLIHLYIFLLLLSFFYILDNSSFSDVSIANAFIWCVACPLFHLVLSFTEQKFLFYWNLGNQLFF